MNEHDWSDPRKLRDLAVVIGKKLIDTPFGLMTAESLLVLADRLEKPKRKP